VVVRARLEANGTQHSGTDFVPKGLSTHAVYEANFARNYGSSTYSCVKNEAWWKCEAGAASVRALRRLRSGPMHNYVWRNTCPPMPLCRSSLGRATTTDCSAIFGKLMR
jgi:hypothetical protein